MKVVTPAVNNPIFIEIQNYTLRKFMKCEYEFIVFNDAKLFPEYTNKGNLNIRNEITNTCKKLNIKCIEIPNPYDSSNPSDRTANALNYILKYQLDNPDTYLIIDSDMFLIDNFYIEDYKDYDCAIVLQTRDKNLNYFWNGLVYFNIYRMKNLNLLDWRCCTNCDTGGMMNEWLKLQTNDFPDTKEIRHTNKNFNTDNIYYIKHLWSLTWDESELPENLRYNSELINFLKQDPRNQNGKFFCEIYDKKFLHYRAGSNWMNNGANNYELSKKLKNVLCV